MNIQEGNFLWNKKTGVIKKYEYLDSDKVCDTLIIGGGITGALTAYMQAKEGANVIVVDKNILGYGTTLKTDGVLLNEMDLTETRNKNLSKEQVNKYNKLCKSGVEDILNIISEISEDEECKKYIDTLEMKKMDVLYYSDRLLDKYYMYKQFEKIGETNSKVEYLEQDPLLNLNVGILVPKAGLILNPYVLTSLIYLYLSKMPNVKIYENTYIENINAKGESVECITNNRFKLISKCAILTSGINTLKYMEHLDLEICKTFNIVTESISKIDTTNTNVIAKNINNKNTIVTFTKDNRIILSGGCIKETDRVEDRTYRCYLEKGKYKKLYYILNKLVPLTTAPKISMCYSAVFLETKDNLPIIDELEKLPNVYCNLSVGRNGIVQSMIGARMLKEVSKKYHIKDMYMFRENR